MSFLARFAFLLPVVALLACREPICGDAIVGAGEACDDGNLLDDDGCSSACQLEFCGDGIPQSNEQCDDGNFEDGDGCRFNCTLEFCGDGITSVGEECDDANALSGDGCDTNCTLTSCGNGISTAGEECDDANALSGDGCDANCTTTRCGNGAAALQEECDDGNLNDNDGCSSSCRTERCGDGITQSNEECDDLNLSPNDDCDLCALTSCGDGVLNNNGPNRFELCDDGNFADGDGCNANCQLERCGDGIINNNGAELCDNGPNNGFAACTFFCTPNVCGDGVFFPGVEGCDDGNLASGDGCSAACLPEFCGDGVLNNGGNEQCDNGAANGNAACTFFCTLNFCGDGTFFLGVEECEDGNNNNNDGCNADCTIERCGDGVLHANAGEVCDDGNVINDDGCSAACQPEFCGDGITQAGRGETCDDGNNNPNDGCDACVQAPCSNGIIDAQLGETCDDGNLADGDGCDSNCTLTACANGIVSQGELCYPEPFRQSLRAVLGAPNNNDFPTAVTSADLDQDGAPEIIVAVRDLAGDNRVRIFSAEGPASLALRSTTFSLFASAAKLIPVDQNGDGLLDIAAVEPSVNLVEFLINQGDGSLLSLSNFGGLSGVRDALFVDVDGDAIPDQLFCVQTTSQVFVIPTSGFGSLLSTGAQPVALGALDADQDGDLDLLVATQGSREVQLFLGAGNGLFGAPAVLATGGTSGFRTLDVADLDADGISDFVATNDNSATAFFGDGAGGFSAQALDLGDTTGAISLLLADGDADGDPDLFALPVFGSGGLAVVLENLGGRLFAAPVLMTTPGDARDLTAVDLFPGGGLELVTSNQNNHSLSLFFSADGLALGEPFLRQPSIAAEAGPVDLQTADLNADGALDAVSVNRDADSLTVLLGDGAGSFVPSAPLLVGNAPRAAAIEDINGDGLLDLLVLNVSQLRVLLGNGDGTFSPGQIFDLGAEGVGLSLGDLNGDTLPDLAIANQTIRGVTFLFHDGASGFAGKIDMPFGFQRTMRGVVTADYTGDGFLDVAVLSDDANSVVSIVTNTGTGPNTNGFSNLQFTNGGPSAALSAADLDGDGAADVSFVTDSGFLAAFRSSPSGIFFVVGSFSAVPVGVGAQSLSVGTPHPLAPRIALVGHRDGTLSLHPLVGANTGAAALTISVGAQVRAVFGSVDGDGIVDILTANQDRASVSVIRSFH